MNFKRIALCVMYVMITMFVVNTATADAEEVSLVNCTTEEAVVIAGTDGQGNSDSVAPAGEAAAGAEEAVAAEVTPVPDDNTGDNADADNNDKKADKKKADKKKADKKKAKYTKAELRLLSALIYCEAGNEPYAGKLAVGIVVMNRKESKDFADSVKGVIYQKCQFSPVRNGSLKRALSRYDSGKFNSAAEKQCIKAAKEALSGEKFVVHNGKDRNFKKYKFFNGHVRGAKYRIKGHMFK